MSLVNQLLSNSLKEVCTRACCPSRKLGTRPVRLSLESEYSVDLQSLAGVSPTRDCSGLHRVGSQDRRSNKSGFACESSRRSAGLGMGRG